jgi:hypothetical protein
MAEEPHEPAPQEHRVFKGLGDKPDGTLCEGVPQSCVCLFQCKQLFINLAIWMFFPFDRVSFEKFEAFDARLSGPI